MQKFPGVPQLAPVPAETVRPFWSVIIPVYERTQFLPECLGSVLAQDPGPEHMEIIVHDNASPNDLRPLVEQWGGRRVRFERNSTWRGLYGNCNDALAKTSGLWVHILHDDDFVLPGFYETLRRALQPQPEAVGMACTHYANLHEPQKTLWSPPLFRDGPGLLENWLERLAVQNPLNVPAVVYRRATMEQVGVFHEDLPYTADWEFYIRATTCTAWWYQPEALARYRVHSQNTTWQIQGEGRANSDIRRTIELAASYLPADVAARALPVARRVHGQNTFAQACQALNANNPRLAEHLMRECLRIGGEIPAHEQFFQALRHPALTTLRQELSAFWRSAVASERP